MRIYAKQVPPEYQESPLFWDGYELENVYIFGNRHFNQHAGRLDEIRRGLEEIAAVFDDMQAGGTYTNNLHAAIWYELPRDDGRGYSRAERLELVKLAQNYTTCSSSAENDILCDVLEIITGHEWNWCTLRGCCQGDWQECIYLADDWSAESLERLEAEYFNTGTEWIVHDESDAPEGPEDINGFSVYCVGWNDEQIKKEIADAAGGDPGAVKLYKFSGYTRRAEYTEAV